MSYLTKSKKHMYFKTKNKLGLTFENCWRSRTCRSLAKCFRNRDKHFGPHVSKWNPVEWSISTYITLIKVIISLLDTAPPVYFPQKSSSLAHSIPSHSMYYPEFSLQTLFFLRLHWKPAQAVFDVWLYAFCLFWFITHAWQKFYKCHKNAFKNAKHYTYKYLCKCE